MALLYHSCAVCSRASTAYMQLVNVTKVACGGQFTMWIATGSLYAAGCPEYGG